MAFRRGWRKGLRSIVRQGVQGSAKKPRPAAACPEWNYGARPPPRNGFFRTAAPRHAGAGGRRRPRGLPDGSLTRSGRPPGLSSRSMTSGKNPIGLRQHDTDPFREAPRDLPACRRPVDEPHRYLQARRRPIDEPRGRVARLGYRPAPVRDATALSRPHQARAPASLKIFAELRASTVHSTLTATGALDEGQSGA